MKIKQLLCLINIHDDEYKYEVVCKTKNQETGNGWWKCKRCGRETEKSGFTHFGIGKIYIKE